jgi:hypothetical protein
MHINEKETGGEADVVTDAAFGLARLVFILCSAGCPNLSARRNCGVKGTEVWLSTCAHQTVVGRGQTGRRHDCLQKRPISRRITRRLVGCTGSITEKSKNLDEKGR